MPTTGSATASRNRTVTLTTASSPLRQTMVGWPFSPMVSTRRIFGAPVAAAHARARAAACTVSPQARSRAATCLRYAAQHLLGIAAPGQFALVQPPDFVGQPAQQFLFVRHQQRGGAGAAQAVERHRGALAHQQVLAARTCWSISSTGAGARFERIVRPQQAGGARCLHGAGRRAAPAPRPAAAAGSFRSRSRR